MLTGAAGIALQTEHANRRDRGSLLYAPLSTDLDLEAQPGLEAEDAPMTVRAKILCENAVYETLGAVAEHG